MRIDIIPINDLSAAMKQDWLKMQVSNPNFRSPFFHPEYFVSVGKFCPEIYVAVLHNDKDLSGFLPFLKDKKRLEAQLIDFCDYEGIIAYPDQNWDMNLILKKMRLNAWNFNALVNFKNIHSQRGAFQLRNSFRIDLTCGLEKYWADIQTKKVRLKDLNDKRRKLGIIKGPLRFVQNCNDLKVLHKLIKWKVSHHHCDEKWANLATRLLEHIFYMKDPHFQGIMPALFAGDELVAADFHLRSNGYLGGLIRTFNPNFEKFSVGILLLHDIINAHKALEFDIADLGPSVHQYKIEYSNSLLPTLKGKFIADSLKEKIKSVHWLYQSLYPIARLKGKIIKKLNHANQKS